MRNFFYTFQIRCIISLSIITAMMLVCIVRVININSDDRLVTNTSNTVTVDLQKKRGDIYFCNGENITSSEEKYATVFLPTETSIIEFLKLAEGQQKKSGLERLSNKKPTVLINKTPVDALGVYNYEIKERYSNVFSLEHILGYVDNTNHGCMGLEKAYDDLLYSDGDFSVSFECDASGEFLLGNEPIVNNEINENGLFLTIDKKIQSIAENAFKDIKKGAVVITEVKSGKIKGMVSKPSFNINNLSEYINQKGSPFLNRVLSAYSVGSVFKPLVAATMLETGNGNFVHNCNGYSEFLGLRFYCNNHDGHGKMNLKDALKLSCNTYFYNGAQRVNSTDLSTMAAAFGFGNKQKIADSIYTQAGSITPYEQLKKSSASVANFAIGQGNIALSPLVISNLYSAIANDGVYYEPTIIEGIKTNKGYKKGEIGQKNIVFSKATAAVLKEALIDTVERGTGVSAKPDFYGAGGKTATAQTGQYENNKEILNAWFCGFFSAKEPKYVIVIMLENASSGGNDCAPIFKKIADNISLLR